MEEKKKYTFIEFIAACESDNFDKIEESAMAWAKNFLENQDWNVVHEGDCTQQAYSCVLCVLQQLLEDYKEYTFDEAKWRKSNDILPKKGKDIIAYDSEGNKHYCYRCNCANPDCVELRCSITGGQLLIDVVSWEYDTQEEKDVQINANNCLLELPFYCCEENDFEEKKPRCKVQCAYCKSI